MAGLLECRALSKNFDAVAAVVDVNLEVTEGSVHSIIGPNGESTIRFMATRQAKNTTATKT